MVVAMGVADCSCPFGGIPLPSSTSAQQDPESGGKQVQCPQGSLAEETT